MWECLRECRRPTTGQSAIWRAWGRHWMDVWRYSDWAGWGQQIRDSQPHIWHWRDWIVESLNRDAPYDRMVVSMLAADEAWPEDESALRATGYLARNFKLLSREKWLQDTVDHTAQAFLGLTLGCAAVTTICMNRSCKRSITRWHDLRAAPGPDRPRPRNTRSVQGWSTSCVRRTA